MIWGKRSFNWADYAPYQDRIEKLLMANPTLYRQFIMVSTKTDKAGESVCYVGVPNEALFTGFGGFDKVIESDLPKVIDVLHVADATTEEFTSRFRFRFLIILIITASTETSMASPAPAEIAKAVTFIFLADDAGNLRTQNGEPVPNGTGFFVLVENDNGPGGYGYLVTAKHVLKNEKGDFFRRVFVRINDRNSGSEFLALDVVPSGGQQNIFVHNDPTVDIAVIPALPDQAKFDFLAVPSSFVKSKEDFKKSMITAGSDVFFAGLFAPHPGDKANTPIFRFGRVAMITSTPSKCKPLV
jgi:hypothetical protein